MRKKHHLSRRSRTLLGCLAMTAALAALGAGCAPHPPPVCDRIAHIQQMPAKPGMTVDDPVYNRLLELGMAASGCLIDQVGNNSIMNNPSTAPSGSQVAVGDVAFFVWLDVSGAPLEELLPPEVVAKLEERGIFAYYAYVAVPGKRRELQTRMREWVERHPDVGG